MPLTRTVVVGTRTVIVRELTVAEVRGWLLDAESGARGDALQLLALDDCSLSDLARMSDATADDLEAYAPSDLAELITACRALNPHFFRYGAALAGVSRLMQAEAGARISSATPADSPSADMPASGPIPGAPT